MTLSEIPGSLKRLTRTPWQFQQTFHTHLQNLPAFVTAILGARNSIRDGCVTIDSVVVEPRHLTALLASCSISEPLCRGSSIVAMGQVETHALLLAAFSDPVDFWFVPAPKSFAIYADHDEFTTFCAVTKSNLNGVVLALSEAGFERVDYTRRF